jgi:hypothetical protein
VAELSAGAMEISMPNGKTKGRGWLVALAVAAGFLAVAGESAAQPIADSVPISVSHVRPKEFGFSDRVTTLSATSFFPSCKADLADPCYWFRISPSFGRYYYYPVGGANVVYFASLDLPAGAIIDSIGLNSTTDTNGVLTVSLLSRDRYANVDPLATFSSTVHGWDTDYSPPLSILVPDHVDKELVLKVEQASDTQLQYFSWVEVHWRRTLSPPPATASFADVPTDHPFFQFIEALKASGITGGCGNGTSFCPNAPLTRGQMAVFLSKALGLHWAN